MRRKTPTVKELAKELAVSSRQIIERCRRGGLLVRNSATVLPPYEGRLVRSWFSADASASGTGGSDGGRSDQRAVPASEPDERRETRRLPFRPLRIRGEPASETLIRERR